MCTWSKDIISKVQLKKIGDQIEAWAKDIRPKMDCGLKSTLWP